MKVQDKVDALLCKILTVAIVLSFAMLPLLTALWFAERIVSILWDPSRHHHHNTNKNYCI